MDKRYQVFVSSTYEDLKEERKEIMQALLELDCMPSGMELFPAADEEQWSLIKKVIDDSDYYILVIGGRYGSLSPDGISYTEMEYDYAVKVKKPIIAFLHKDPSEIPVGKTEKTESGREKLDIFKEKVKKRLCKYWTSPADLGSVVSRSLVKLIKSSPAIGWVKASNIPSEGDVQEILRLRNKLEDLEGQLFQARHQAPEGTEKLSQGDDPLSIKMSYSSFRSNYWDSDAERHSQVVNTTWNKIFSQVSPLMVNEADDKELLNSLSSAIGNTLRSKFEKKHHPLKVGSFQLDGDDYQTIKVQFLALGLIEQSIRQRSVKDTKNYWRLTPYGHNVMTKLRAILKPEFQGEE